MRRFGAGRGDITESEAKDIFIISIATPIVYFLLSNFLGGTKLPAFSLTGADMAVVTLTYIFYFASFTLVSLGYVFVKTRSIPDTDELLASAGRGILFAAMLPTLAIVLKVPAITGVFLFMVAILVGVFSETVINKFVAT